MDRAKNKKKSIVGGITSCIIFVQCLKKSKSLLSIQLLLPEMLIHSCCHSTQEDWMFLFFPFWPRMITIMGEDLLVINIGGFLWKLTAEELSENQNVSCFLSKGPASLTFLRWQHCCINHTEVADVSHYCTLFQGLCCPLQGHRSCWSQNILSWNGP